MTSRISHHGHLGHLGHLGHDHDRTGDPPSVTENDRTAPGGSGQVRSWSCQRCALLDHPGLYDDIKSLLLASAPKYIMHQTASGGLLTDTAQLIQEGYQVNERDPQNRTPLYYASRNGQREICCLLLKHGASVGAKVDNGETALH